MARSDLGARVGVAAVGIPLVLLCLWAGGWALGGLVAAVAGVAAREFYRLVEARGVRPFSGLGIMASITVVLAATAFPTPTGAGALAAGILVAVALTSLGAAVWLRWPGGEPMAAVATTVTGVAYVGVPLAFVPLLREIAQVGETAGSLPVSHAVGFLLLPLLATWAGDSAAYFVGRAWGRHKLAPTASPGKTVEGGVAGLVGSSLAAVLVSILALSRVPGLEIGPVAAAVMGVLLGAAAQVGDLAESVLKREAGVKDSGHLLPGHGGMLDRIDALLVAFPVAWLLLTVAWAIR